MKTRLLVAGVLLATLSNGLQADTGSMRADSHAPIGVMGDHMHKKGEWMFSYRFMTMDMAGNLKGTKNIDPETIVATESNPFSGMAGMPPTLRIVPLTMHMDMHMLGMMYAPSDRVTLMVMTNYVDKSMHHVTYMGGAGTTELGNFRTSTGGWGDTSISGLFSFPHQGVIKAHAILGVSIPTGSTDETEQILTPMNMTPTVRVPYPMQLGSGSYDPIVGFALVGSSDRIGWGGQWRSMYRLSDNDDDYSLGDEHRATGWLSYLFSNSISGSTRLEYFRRDDVSGRDPLIVGPVQTADPNRQAIDRLDLAMGMNLVANKGNLHGWRLGLEYIVPVHQDIDGPQLETDEQIIVGVQKMF